MIFRFDVAPTSFLSLELWAVAVIFFCDAISLELWAVAVIFFCDVFSVRVGALDSGVDASVNDEDLEVLLLVNEIDLEVPMVVVISEGT